MSTMLFGYIDDEPVWSCPTTLPDLSNENVIALDTETYDPNLKERGAGWAFDDGFVIGVSVAVNESDRWYFPVRNATNNIGFDAHDIVEWINRTFTSNKLMVGANLMYDIGWLYHMGVDRLTCSLFDVQFAEALLDEHKHEYSLDSIAKTYGLGGKESGALYKWCSDSFGGPPDGRQRSNIYRAPIRLVGPYAEADASLPLQIMEHQYMLLEDQELLQVADLEHALIPILIAMRLRGVRVDTQARDNLSDYIEERLDSANKTVLKFAGRPINTNAAADIAKVFDSHGWDYPLLPPTKRQLAKEAATGIPTKPKPSFTKTWLMAHDEPFARAVADVRRLGKLKGTFVDGYFELANNGRIHCSLHPLRTGENGTVSGRLSCIAGAVPVTTINGPVRMDEIKKGDFVLTHKGRFREVLNTMFTGSDEVYRLHLTTTDLLVCTEDHKILTEAGWLTLAEMNGRSDGNGTCGQPLIATCVDGKPLLGDICLVTPLGVMAVYDLEVDEDHSFIAGGVAVHNCSVPNLQNIPARDPEFGPKIRALFLPEENEQWVSHDYSQIELRLLLHYAMGAGADDARKLFNTDLSADFHQMVMDKTGLPRKPAKTISFSLCYGSGVKNTADLLSCSMDEARAFRDAHFDGMPFMKTTFDKCAHVAQTRGYLFTIMGRRARFNTWEPSNYDLAQTLGVFDSKDDCAKAVCRELGMDIVTGSLAKRARAYKALNSLLQGSAADMMKKAMVDIWNSGICDVLGAPLITVHDELNWSEPDTKEGREATAEAAHIMEQAIQLNVPVVVSRERGSNWGDLS